MRLFIKLFAILAITLCAQVGYEVVWSFSNYPLDAYSLTAAQADAAINTERQLNSCNFLTRRIVATIIAIPLPGEA